MKASTKANIILRRYPYVELLVANSRSIRPSSTRSMAASCQRDERLLALSGSGQMVNSQTNFSMALQDRKNGENTDQFTEYGPVLSQKCKLSQPSSTSAAKVHGN